MKPTPEQEAQYARLREDMRRFHDRKVIDFTARRIGREQIGNDLAMEISRLFRSADAAGKQEKETEE